MIKKKTFYVTTAIDYVNAEPHIGHAYQKIIADVLARWHRLLGEDVFFLTGTDEHGKKIQRAAESVGEDPRRFVDKVSKKFKEAWKLLELSHDRFIRTTDNDHKKVVLEFIKKANDVGDIYKGVYEGWYCVGCEAYYTEKDAPDFICPTHKKPLERIKEESYFFKLSKYQDFLLDLYKKHPEFVLPDKRRNEIVNRVKEGLKDLSITRTGFDWGIPFPLEKGHYTYVWFDALINYYTAVREKGKEKYWPANVHILGKDNSWFHCVYWPAMLKSVGIELPKTVFNHGFLTFNGQKISKSLGNAISIKTLVDKYGADTIKYFCVRNFPFAEGDDGDFSEKVLIDRHNNELGNKLGNLVSRVEGLVEKNGLSKVDNKLLKKLGLKKIKKFMSNYEFDKALNEIFSFVDVCNEYVQSEKPWESKDKKVLYELVDSIKAIAIVLWPFIPSTSEEIAKRFGFALTFEEIGKPIKVKKGIKKGDVLFKRVE
jgi:methionyl-tRNA synthetase